MSGNNPSLAIVTGAAGGIGSALCALLVQRGTKACALDIDSEGLMGG